MTRILLVEDDLFLREVYQDILKDPELIIETAEDGEVAYEKIKEGGWDLVLLDVVLPKISGIDIVKKLKAEMQKIPAKKIIFLTNTSDTKDLEEMSKLGDGYISKSDVDPSEFVSKIKGYLV